VGRRQNVLVLAGVVAFVIGIALVFVVLRNDGSSSSSAGGGATVDVLVAKQDIPAGTKGEDAQAMVKVDRVSANDRQADALATQSQLSNQVFNATFKSGEQIRTGGLSARSLVKQVAVPEGLEAVAVSLPFTAAGAGYVAPGDKVNVYQVFPSAATTSAGQAGGPSYPTPRTQLLMSNVQVLDVQFQAAPLTATATTAAQASTATRPGAVASNITVVLALNTSNAERAIFGSSTDNLSLYLTRVNDKNAPAAPTDGHFYANQFPQ
jgi:pilus assembly protein CpaB